MHGVGFLPGGESLRYGPSVRIVVMKNRESSPLIEEWCRRTRKSLHDLSMANYAFLVDQDTNGSYRIEFVKCRDRNRILSWCHEQWGESDPDGQWILFQRESYNPRLIVRGDDNLMLFKMVWA